MSRDRKVKKITLELYAEVKAVYARIPSANCKGLCQAYCGLVFSTSLEEGVLRKQTGEGSTFLARMKAAAEYGGSKDCAYLTPEGKCKGYEFRPIICRLWGVVPDMPCPHGCQPAGGMLSDDQSQGMIAETLKISERWERELERLGH